MKYLLINLNNKITETNALTDAPKSNSKFQDWGEFILEKLLQNSG